MPTARTLRLLILACLSVLATSAGAQGERATSELAATAAAQMQPHVQPATLRRTSAHDGEALKVAAAASAPARPQGLHGTTPPPEALGTDPPAFLLFVSALIVVLFISTRRTRRED